MQPKRFWEIDFLRGVSIVLVILIHCTVYFYSDPFARTIWNISQFSVPVFIFCSFYIFFAKEFFRQEPFFNYLFKRANRLLIPYFIFTLLFFIMLFFLKPQQLNTNYILQSFTLTGGLEINWLILLFLQLTVILSVLKAVKNKYVLLYFLLILSVLSSLFLVFFNLPSAINHKLFMWLPWSLMLGFTYLFVKFQTKKLWLMLVGVGAFIISVLLYFYLQSVGDSTIFRENKYPPNLYYLSFGMWSIILLSFIAPFFKSFEKPITYLSNNSYQLFFIHYFFLIWFTTYKSFLTLPWWIFFLIVFGVTLTCLWTINFLRKLPKQSS